MNNQDNDDELADDRVDPSLAGYQDDIASGDAEDELQNEQGDSPSDVTMMPERQLREELDKLALDEDRQDDEPTGDDWREHVEDVDEGDKR